MQARDGLGLAQALVTLTLTGDHRTAAALAERYVDEYDPAELLVWMSRYSGLILELLSRADSLGRSPSELAGALATQIARTPDEPPPPGTSGPAVTPEPPVL